MKSKTDRKFVKKDGSGSDARRGGAGAGGAGGYRPRDIYAANPELKQVIDQIAHGTFSPDQPHRFMPIVHALLDHGDHYLLLADYAQYMATHARVDALYADTDAWTTMAIRNVAGMGPFSSDRTVRDYAANVWNVQPLDA